MELVESNFELLSCGEPCGDHHPAPPQWTGKSINPKCILHTLVRIMKDTISEDQVKRQIYLLQDLKCGLTCGFWIQDIQDATKLIEILMCKGEVLPIFFEYAKYFLGLMKYPPLMCRTNEILDYSQNVQNYFDFFGYILVTTSKQIVREIIMNSLQQLLEYKETLPDHSMPWTIMTRQIELSNLPLILTQYMELCNNDIYFDLVKMISIIATFSASMCMTLIKDGCLQIIMMRLNPQWQEHLGGPRPQYENYIVDHDYPLDDSIMLIHTLLDTYHNYSSDEVKNEINSPGVEALWGLRYALRLYTIDERYKNERNFTAALWLLFAECFPGAKHVQSGIVHDFAILSKIGDCTQGGKWLATVQFNFSDINDYELKKISMIGLIVFHHCLGADRIYEDEEIMFALCKLLNKDITCWAPRFYDTLLLTVLNVLQHIVSEHVSAFLCASGQTHIVNILHQLVISGDYEQRFDVYFQALRFSITMIRVLAKNSCLYKEDIETQSKLQRNIIEKLFDMDLKLKNQKIMAQSVHILGILPANECAANVEFAVALFNRVLNPRPTDSAYIQRLIVYSVWLIWNNGLHNNVNFYYFIKLKGIYVMLDLIKNAAFTVKLICLGYLVDIIQEGTAIPYVVTWQKDGVGFLSLLVNIFRKECQQLGVELSSRGVITDPKFPLMGTIQKEALLNKKYSFEVSPSITDLFVSCRPKIYAILQLLSNHHGQTLDLLNDYYKTYDSNLSTDDKITKILCENYLVIKLGEMWMELDLEMSPIQPAPGHKFMLDTLLNHFLDCGQKIQKLQNNWLAIERKNEHISEEEFYHLLRETKLGPAIQGLAEMKYLARATNAKIRQSYTYARESLTELGIIETHRTLQCVNTFRFFSQKLVIQSDIIKEPFAQIPPDLVSEDSNDRMSIFDGSISGISLSFSIDCKES